MRQLTTAFPSHHAGKWETTTLGEIGDIANGATPSTHVSGHWNGSIPWCTPTDITGAPGKYLVETERMITPSGLASCSARVLPSGALLLCSRATIGKIKIATEPTCTNQGFKSIVCRRGAHNEFIYYLLLTLEPTMVGRATGSTFLEISKRDVAAIEIQLPSVDEQIAIADVLSDVDRLLGSLDALIAKKRAVKHATMQQLLTGRTRLPGFSSTWQVQRFRDLLRYERPDPYIVRSAEYTDIGDTPVLTANKSFILGYTNETDGICHDIPAIVFDDFTTDSKYATVPFKVKSSAIKLLRAKDSRINLACVFHRMRFVHFDATEHKRHYISDYQNIDLPFPELAEQEAIASVLSDMDAEITALERRRDKTLAIKKGMMRQLLTGRVRLPKAA